MIHFGWLFVGSLIWGWTDMKYDPDGDSLCPFTGVCPQRVPIQDGLDDLVEFGGADASVGTLFDIKSGDANFTCIHIIFCMSHCRT